MNLDIVIEQIPLIELSVITSVVLIHFSRKFFGFSQSSVAGLCFIVFCTVLLLLPLNSLGAPWNLPLVAYIRGVSGELSIVTMMLILFTWSSAPAYRLSSVTPLIITASEIISASHERFVKKNKRAIIITATTKMMDPYPQLYGSNIVNPKANG